MEKKNYVQKPFIVAIVILSAMRIALFYEKAIRLYLQPVSGEVAQTVRAQDS